MKGYILTFEVLKIVIIENVDQEIQVSSASRAKLLRKACPIGVLKELR